MKLILITLFAFCYALEAHTIKLTIGEALPKNAEESVLRDMLTQIESSSTWLHLSNGLTDDYAYTAYKDKDNRFIIGWVTQTGLVHSIYIIKGNPKWDLDKIKPIELPEGTTILIDCKTGSFTITGALSTETKK